MLTAQTLAVSIGGQSVCRDLDLNIEAGSRWAILGVNGVGKTTLLSTLAGLRAPDGGTLLLDGAPLACMAPRARALRCGLMTQEDSFHISDPETTVLEVALLGRQPHLDWWRAESAHDLELANTALAAVGLADLPGIATRRAAMLSGGERRRLALAALLAQEVPLCLLDEPTAHLDLHQQIAFMDLLIGWNGRTLVMTLHDVNLAARYCTHALLLFGAGQWCAGPLVDMLSAEMLTRLYRHPVIAIDTPTGVAYLPR